MGEFRAERGWTGLVHVSDVRARYDAPPDPEVGRAGVEVKVEGNAGRANLDRDDILQTVGLLAWVHTSYQGKHPRYSLCQSRWLTQARPR